VPVSHQHKVIFVHIPRTAGSSVSQVFGICGDDNQGVLTPARPDMLYGLVGNKVLQHLTARDIQKRLGKDVYNSYFKFAFVRNPYDRAVSTFHVRKRLLPRLQMSFRDFVLKRVAQKKQSGMATFFRSRAEKALEDQFQSQHEFIFNESGGSLVDFIARYESIQSDFKKIRDRFGLKAELPAMNTSEHGKYQTYYDEDTKKMIGEIYRKDLEIFEYAF
jgi:hypothetical protein